MFEDVCNKMPFKKHDEFKKNYRTVSVLEVSFSTILCQFYWSIVLLTLMLKKKRKAIF